MPLAQDKTKVTVFEAWFIHNESMGSPTAVEKGFFEGLDVKVVGGGPGLSSIDRVMAESKGGGIAFGVDYPYNLLEAREKQKLPLVAVAHDFQKSAVRLISWKEIKSAKDIEGTVATWIGYDKQVKAAIGPDWAKKIKVVNQQGDPATIGSWLKKDYPFAHAMIYNEILVAKRTAKEKYWTYSFADFGIDWPENVVFTTEETVKKHPEGGPGLPRRAVQGLQAGPGQPRRGRPDAHEVQQQPQGAGEARAGGHGGHRLGHGDRATPRPRGSGTSTRPAGTASPAT